MQRFRTGAGKAEADALPPCSCTSDGSRPPPLAPRIIRRRSEHLLASESTAAVVVTLS